VVFRKPPHSRRDVSDLGFVARLIRQLSTSLVIGGSLTASLSLPRPRSSACRSINCSSLLPRPPLPSFQVRSGSSRPCTHKSRLANSSWSLSREADIRRRNRLTPSPRRRAICICLETLRPSALAILGGAIYCALFIVSWTFCWWNFSSAAFNGTSLTVSLSILPVKRNGGW
jgi:hypothetical protein